MRQRCQNQVVCGFCSARGHEKDGCSFGDQPNRRKCANCKGAHEASSRLCAKYQDNLAILNLAYSRKPPLPFKEAQKLFVEQKRSAPVETRVEPKTQNSYASAVSRRENRNSGSGRANADVSTVAPTQQSFRYNPNGVTLDKSELESPVFSN